MMAPDDSALMTLVRAIVGDDAATVSRLLASSPDLATARLQEGAARQTASQYYLEAIGHYLYAGDTALHVAAAAYLPPMVRMLLAAGAVIGASNRRGAQPLHHAADGRPGSRRWNPGAQAETIACLIEAGADPNARDRNGATPLHRAVRCRCAAAATALLAGGADPQSRKGSGSTALELAIRTTGRGGSGSPQARAQQQEILRALQEYDGLHTQTGV
jgi:hypothetical protein